MRLKWSEKIFDMSKFFCHVCRIIVILGFLVSTHTGYTQVLEETYVATNWEDLRLEEAFLNIQQQTDFYFTYDFEAIKNISISNQNSRIRLAKLLKYIASKTNLHFTVQEEIIYVTLDSFSRHSIAQSRKQKLHLDVPELQSIRFQDLDDQKIIYKISKNKSADEKKIKGTVLDEVGNPLPGASILIKEKGLGTIADTEGAFSLVIPKGKVSELVVSFVGYQTQELLINYKKPLFISMEPIVTDLKQVVVIGYGTGTKEKFNGAVSSVDKESLNAYSSANFEQTLVGNIAGVQILGNGKNPGDNSVIQIRGLTTLTAGTNPLIVVDGIPLTEGASLSSLNNQDIESIDILKDAASAAIYGSRASNGVILITTKRSEAGKSEDASDKKMTIIYDFYLGIQERIDKFELADAYGTAQFDYDARNFGYISDGEGRSIYDDNSTRDANGGGKRSRIQDFLPSYLAGTPGLTNTDWLDAVFRSAPQQSHYLNFTGGASSTGYSVSFGYFDQDNIIIDSDYKRYTTNFQLNTKVSDHIRFGISSNVSFSDANPTGEAGWARYSLRERDQADPAFAAILMHPYYPVYEPGGSLAIAAQLDDNNQNWDGPIAENTIAHVKLSDYKEQFFRVFGNTYLELEPISGLTFKSLLGGDYNTGLETFFAPSTFGNYRIPVEDNRAQAFRNDEERANFITENLLTYRNVFGRHSFDVLVGYSYQQETQNNTRLSSEDFADDNLRNIAGATNLIATSNSSKWALESFFSRLQYGFANRYALSISFRRDGSSRFGSNTKYGNFASFSAGWTLSNEPFFPENDFLSFAKLRFSWGQTGNNQIGDFASVALIEEDNYVLEDDLVAGVYTETAPNPDLSWETNTAQNFGLDLGFWNNKLLLTAEYYNSKTTDLLLNVPVPQQSGFSQSLQNVGALANKGFELELRGNHFSIGKISLGFNANFNTNQNEVLALGFGQQQLIVNNGGVDFMTRVGASIAQFYVYDIIGVYRSPEEIENDPVAPLPGTEVGDYVVRDVNGDGQINPDDRTLLGDYNPDFSYGFGFNLKYKSFDLGLQFSGIEGRMAADRMVYYTESGEGFFVPSQYYLDNYFSERNPDGFFRRPDFSSFSSAGRLTRSSSLSVLDADYFRLRSFHFGYTIPKKWTEGVGIEHLRFYLTANNLFNLSNFRGYNPDGIDTRSISRQTLTRGWIQSASPLTRFIAFGINIKF